MNIGQNHRIDAPPAYKRGRLPITLRLDDNLVCLASGKTIED